MMTVDRKKNIEILSVLPEEDSDQGKEEGGGRGGGWL